MIFEHYSEPVLPLEKWLYRVARSFGLAGLFVFLALSIGVTGYHFLGDLKWIDALLEASMILGGMGAVAPMTSVSVKLFASAYALFSGLMGVSIMAVLLAPWLHRMLHFANSKPKK
jgi:hypothetical protein